MEVSRLNTIRIATLFALAGLMIVAGADARVIIVPDQSPTVRHAIQAAIAGDVIQLRPGRYEEAFLELLDGVTIMGDPDDPASYIIDGGGRGRVFRAESVGGVQVIGLTVTGGNAMGPGSYSASGGGAFISRSSVILNHVIFDSNTAEASGGGVRAAYSSVEFNDCVFSANRAVKGGGAIDLSYDCNATARRTVFDGNRAAWGGAISARTGSSCLFEDSDFTGNSTLPPQELGGAFFADHAARVTFRRCLMSGNSARQGGAARLADAVSGFGNCTIDGNTAWEDGAGFMVRGGSLVLERSIVSFNDGMAVTMETGSVWVSSSDIHGNTGGDWTGPLADMLGQAGNIDADPMYCDLESYEISSQSPCAAANSDRGLIGAREVGCELVSVELLGFTAELQLPEVHLRWTVSNGGSYEYRLTGLAQNDPTVPSWTVRHEPGSTPGRYVATDKPTTSVFPILYRLEARLDDGDWFLLGELTTERPFDISSGLALESVYPNPFNPQVTIAFRITEPALVRASIHDLLGRRVRTLHQGNLDAGRHELTWDSRDDRGQALATGTYLLRIDGGGPAFTRKLLLVK